MNDFERLIIRFLKLRNKNKWFSDKVDSFLQDWGDIISALIAYLIVIFALYIIYYCL